MSSIAAGTTLTTALVSTGDTTGELVLKTNGTTTAVTIGTDQSVAFVGGVSSPSLTVNSNNISADNSLGFRNRIINGDMRIDQRNAGAAVTGSGEFPVDRFLVGNTTDGAFSAQQDSSAPAGFINSVKLTTTTADATLTTTQALVFLQRIEGTNVADLGFGTASAKTVTVSFWVRSSLTGTFGGSLRNNAGDRSYPFSYSISVADTWEQKSVTIAGDTSGTWLTTNGVGITISFGLGAGPDRSGTAGAWNSNNNASATGATSVIGTLNATWYITGVQLEVGSVATPFERRPYGAELALCQRYFAKLSIASDGGVFSAFGSGIQSASTAGYYYVKHPITMRASPTVNGSTLAVSNFSTTVAVNSFGTSFMGLDASTVGVNTTGAATGANTLLSNNSVAGNLTLSSEL